MSPSPSATIRIRKHLDVKLEKLAAKTGRPKQHYVDLAVARWLAENEAAEMKNIPD